MEKGSGAELFIHRGGNGGPFFGFGLVGGHDPQRLFDGVFNVTEGGRMENVLVGAVDSFEEVLKNSEMLQKISGRIAKSDNAFYIGRGADYHVACEAALKLKEISYIHAESYAAGELKHGTISLIERGTPVIAIATDPKLYEKIDSNIREVHARGAYTILLTNRENAKKLPWCDEVIALPGERRIASIFSSVCAVQLLAYFTAIIRGCDIDKPRNLAKSVTVE